MPFSGKLCVNPEEKQGPGPKLTIDTFSFSGTNLTYSYTLSLAGPSGSASGLFGLSLVTCGSLNGAAPSTLYTTNTRNTDGSLAIPFASGVGTLTLARNNSSSQEVLLIAGATG